MEGEEKITWAEIQDLINVVKIQNQLMLQYQDNVSQEDMPQRTAEGLCVNPIKKIHAICS